MKKYKSSVAAVSSQQVILQNQSCAIIELEKEKIRLNDEVVELSTKIDIFENETVNSSKIQRLEMKNKDLKHKLEANNNSKLEVSKVRNNIETLMSLSSKVL